MGGESSGGGNSVDRSNPNEMRAREMAEATNRAKEEQERKSRQVAFDDYQQQRKAAAQGIDEMISPQKASTVRENAGLAMMLAMLLVLTLLPCFLISFKPFGNTN